MRPLRLLIAAALCATLLAPAIAQSAQSNELKRFFTPSRNIGCFGDSKTVRCDLRTTTGTPPKRPANCELEWGDAFELNRTGKGHGICHGDTALPAPSEKGPILKYGHTIKLGTKLKCTSKRTGLTCRSTSGHGFKLSKTVIKLF